MPNAELIKALRRCAETWNTIDDCNVAGCPFTAYGSMCLDTMLEAAADALEAAEKRIEQLEMDLLNGTISNIDRYKVYEYTVRDLILFAELCKRNDVREADLKQAAWNLELAVRAVQNERMEIVKKWSDEMSNGISARLIPNFEKAFEEMGGEHDEH